ncbi:hypothetical protein BB560_001228 [Smittium megazygosporum]|uniref:Uncharacterized protein n=1 Tax=Smittium megazygosporum TaxID=133381 RepID=A0A2T9ZI48_9FUNG|nr:hypothetical protein BB560_001228 [Smittium megazygosporum]
MAKSDFGSSEFTDLSEEKVQLVPVKEHIPFYGRMVSAVLGGIATSLLMTPFDVVKTRLQAQLAQNLDFSTQPLPKQQVPLPTFAQNCKTPSSCLCPTDSIPSFRSNNSTVFNFAAKLAPRSLAKSPEFYLKHWNSNLCSLDSSAFGFPRTGKLSPLSFMSQPLPVNQLSNPNYISGTWDGFRSIYRNEGIFSLWRGLSVTLVGALPSTVTYFAGYDVLSIYLNSEVPALGLYTPLVAGCLARTVTAFMISPLELIRTRMQSASSQNFSTVFNGLKSSVKARGISTLWTGLVPTLYRDVPFSAIYWFSFERTKSFLSKKETFSLSPNRKSSNIFVSFLSGAFSGTVAAIVTHPFDVVKTAHQAILSTTHTKSGSVSGNYGTASVLNHIISKDGIAGFYSGLSPRLIKIAPACAIMISSYEFGKSFFKT